MNNWLGLDIGGANIKAANTSGKSRSVAFPLWQSPDLLAHELDELAKQFPDSNNFAITMTGELADCFASKQAGVEFITETCLACFGSNRCWFYQTTGQFAAFKRSQAEWLLTAAANWHAVAHWVSRHISNAYWIDIGSTTTDIIPINSGKVQSNRMTDLDRIRSSQLVYTGIRRSPLCSLVSHVKLGPDSVVLAQELFATMYDVYLWLKNIPESEADFGTADGRPATRMAARHRIAKMVCADSSELSDEQVSQIATTAAVNQRALIVSAIQNVVSQNSLANPTFVVSGEGDWLALDLLTSAVRRPTDDMIRLADLFPAHPPLSSKDTMRLSSCIPAYAVALLAAAELSATAGSTQ